MILNEGRNIKEIKLEIIDFIEKSENIERKFVKGYLEE
jgi:hypothetical protein